MQVALVGKEKSILSLYYFSMKNIMELFIENKELDCFIYLHSGWSNTQVKQDLKDPISKLK